MSTSVACQSPVMHDLSRPNCPCCGSVLLIAEESVFNAKGCIRHAWACDDCGHAFVTSILLKPHEVSASH